MIYSVCCRRRAGFGNNADWAEFASYFGFENPMFRDASLEPAWVRSTPADLYFRRDPNVSHVMTRQSACVCSS